MVRSIAAISLDDGLEFDADEATAEDPAQRQWLPREVADGIPISTSKAQGSDADGIDAPHMRNVFWLRPGVIGGRSGPNLDVWDPKDLAAGGVGAVLSVNDGELVRPQELAAVGIDYRCVPLSDAAPPQPGDLEICTSALPRALEFTMASIDRRRSVVVHCRSGKDRTGLFLSYYLCEIERLKPSEAIRELKRVRPIALSADGWEAFSYRVLGELGFVD